MKRFVIAGLGTALLALSCFIATANAVETIKLGVAGAHSGDLAPYGLPTRDAAEMVVAAVNAQGGINGKPIELVILDDQCKAEVATNVATKLASQGVGLVVGHICSGATKAALGIYKDARIIVISPAATNPPLTKSGAYPNFFRTIASDDDQGKLAAAFVTGKLGAKKIAIIHDKGDYGKGFADYARAAIEAGGQGRVVLFEGVSPDAVDYAAVLQKLRREGADVLLFGGYHPLASKLIAQMKRKQINLPFVGPDGVKGDGFLKLAGKDAEGVYATGPMDVSKFPVNLKAHSDYKARFGKEPGTFFDQGYAAILVALNAVKVSGGTSYDGLSRALRSSPVETPVGKIKFDAKGDAEGVGFAVYQVRNGTFVEVK